MDKQNKLLKAFFIHKIGIKMLHFQTKYFGTHKALDEYLVKFDANFDRFMEVSQGINGIINIKSIDLKVKTLTDKNAQSKLSDFGELLQEMSATHEKHPDLLAIRDEMLADVNQLKYLLLFK
jgi:hypothetical protein